MAQLSDTDKAAFREFTARGWEQSSTERSPRVVEQTTEARNRYARWASDASIFFKGQKLVDFSGDHWKL